MPEITFHIIREEHLPSTQQYLSKLSHNESLQEGTLVITANQNAGIGQEGNHWESEAGKNLTFSFIIKPGFLEIGNQFMLNKMVSLAVLQCLSKLPGIQNNLSVKWPNDIYVGNKKIGGILISNAIMGNSFEHSIIGIGLNINQELFSDYCPNPTSLILETGKFHEPKEILSNLLFSVSESYQSLKYQPEILDLHYLEALFQYREWKPYEILGTKHEAMIRGINEYGKLQVDIKGMGVTECDIKEIKYL